MTPKDRHRGNPAPADVRIVLAQTAMHDHRISGVWDSDNRPGLAGTRCVECAARSRLWAWLESAGV